MNKARNIKRQIEAFSHANKVGTDVIRRKMGEVLDCVNLRGDEYIIERKSKALAALIPVEKYSSLNKLAKETALDLLSRHSSNNKLTDSDVDSITTEAKHLTRK